MRKTVKSIIDLHTHTLFSDGDLLPAELVNRCARSGYKAVCISDHADASNIDFIVTSALRIAKALNSRWNITVVPGIEITHNPVEDIPALVAEARKLGARIVVVHGETPVEPVPEGTNAAAIAAGADILAHPGYITAPEVKQAAKNGVALEISGRKGHCLSNGHVARLALETGARLVINSDAHSPGDIFTPEMVWKVGAGAGIPEKILKKVLHDSEGLVKRAMGKARRGKNT